MATLLLTAVGTALGGPIGGAIGAILGQSIDQAVLGPKGRQGPRLGDLSVQTSRYGNAVPRVFGTVRAAGTVIWATDLIETRSSVSNGKGRPRAESYSYAASFAVALSARPVLRVGRIWADGNLLRGSSGDFKTATGFRLWTGGEDQPLDPLIAAAEGLAATPAYRGCAYAVFEDFQLAAYGNRIPTLSFEIVADEGALPLSRILGVLSAGVITGDTPALIDGVAVQGDSVRGVAATFAAALPLSLTDTGTVLALADAAAGARTLDEGDRGAAPAGSSAGRSSEDRRAAASIPEVLSIAYYDPQRDFQSGVQRARREGGSRREDRIDLAATVSAGVAKAIAEARLTGLWRERRTLTVTLPWRALDIRPGDRVTLGDMPGVWRVAAVAFERMVVRLELVPLAGAARGVPLADAGRPVTQNDRLHGATTLIVLDLPPLRDSAESAAHVVVAANGASGGWRSAPLLASRDGGASFVAIGATALPAVLGTTETMLGTGNAFLIDRVSSVDVALVHAGLSLGDADDAALLAGANFAMVGAEALQFGRALPLGGGRYRLSQLWRGRRGTEAAMAGHAAGDAFVLIERDTLASVPADLAVDGLTLLATGIGDGAGVAAELARTGAAITPLAPVALTAVQVADGIVVRWIRRSREGWAWPDAIDVPLGEAQELYRVTRTGVGLDPFATEVTEPAWTYPPAMLAADRAAGAPTVHIEVRQIGTRALSLPATITLAL